MAPIVPGQAPPAVPMTELPCACGESARFQVTSYQRPVVVGEPPVTNDARPGKESDGVDVEALV